MAPSPLTRRAFTVAVAVAVAVAMTVTVGGGLLARIPRVHAAKAPAVDATARPNIVFILTDDLDLTTYDPAKFPALRDLASRGVTFSHFMVNNSLCCPSRASILRGQYVHNHGVEENGPPKGGFQRFHALGDERSTVATWLHAAGYRTALLGKYLNHYPDTTSATYVPPGWDEWASPSAGNPYTEYRYQMNENGTLVRYGSQPTDYLVDVLARKSVDFIDRTAGKQPFFLYVAPYVPHQPATPAPRYANAFPKVLAPHPPSFNQADVSAEPNWLRERPELGNVAVAYIDDLYRRRLQDMLAVDDLLSDVVDSLRATGQLDNTYIFLGSDNGFHLGQHRLPPGKETAFDEDIRVPLWVRGPGVPRGKTVGRLAMNVDLAPTFAAIAGVKVPPFVDGRSLAPLLGDGSPPKSWRHDAFVEHYKLASRGRARRRTTSTTEPVSRFRNDSPEAPNDPDEDEGYTRARIPESAADAAAARITRINPFGVGVPDYHAIRTSRYLYAEYETGERQLYDLARDPYEMHNIAGSAKSSLLHKLSSRLHALASCRAAACRRIESKPL
ncbi:MAG: sulfatase [Acidimicrobiia bacterium]